MKKIVVVVLFLVSVSAFSQIELIETAKVKMIGKITDAYMEKIGDDEYNLFYKNVKAIGKEYDNFSFKNINNDYDALYQILMNGFKEASRDPLKIKANGEIVWLQFTYINEDNMVTLEFKQNANNENNPDELTVSRPFTAEEITKLFNK